AFACNSLLCRMAIRGGTIDAASFTTIRFCSGAAALLLLAAVSGTLPDAARAGSWLAAIVLFVYAFPFAFAYARLPAGTGALLLFGAAQITMIAAGLLDGERPSAAEWIGLALASAGLVWLVTPGLSTPSLTGAALMAVAGITWG